VKSSGETDGGARGSGVVSQILLGGTKFLTLSVQQYFVWDAASQRTK